MEKVDYVHGTFTLVDTDPLQFEYESYEDFCEINGMEPQGEDSTDFYEWCGEEAEEQYNCDMDEIRSCKEYNVPCVITGHLGLWDGKHEIVPVRMDTIHDAIVKCYEHDGELRVNYEDGEIVVYHSHHDGTNVFHINALSKNGEKKFEDYEYKGVPLNLNKRDIKRIPYLYAIGA